MHLCQLCTLFSQSLLPVLTITLLQLQVRLQHEQHIHGAPVARPDTPHALFHHMLSQAPGRQPNHALSLPVTPDPAPAIEAGHPFGSSTASDALMMVYHAALRSPHQAVRPDVSGIKRARMAMRRGLSPEEEDRGMLFLGHEPIPSAASLRTAPWTADRPGLPTVEGPQAYPPVANHAICAKSADLPQQAVWFGDGPTAEQLPPECLLPDEAAQSAGGLVDGVTAQHATVFPDLAMQEESELPVDDPQSDRELADVAGQHSSELPDLALHADSELPKEAIQQPAQHLPHDTLVDSRVCNETMQLDKKLPDLAMGLESPDEAMQHESELSDEAMPQANSAEHTEGKISSSRLPLHCLLHHHIRTKFPVSSQSTSLCGGTLHLILYRCTESRV